MGFADRCQSAAARLVGRPAFWVAFLAFAVAWPIVRTLTRDAPSKVPIVGTVGGFRLIDQHGQAFGDSELRGRVWIGSVACVRCRWAIPGAPARLATLQHRTRNLGEALHLVTFALAPMEDAPASLASETDRVSTLRWSFLGGPREDVEHAITETFGMLLPRGRPGEPRMKAFDPANAWTLALVDGELRVRGYYDLREDGDVDALMRDVELVLAEPAS